LLHTATVGFFVGSEELSHPWVRIRNREERRLKLREPGQRDSHAGVRFARLTIDITSRCRSMEQLSCEVRLGHVVHPCSSRLLLIPLRAETSARSMSAHAAWYKRGQ